MLKLKPARKFGGELTVPGDKSIAHRAALLSILSKGPITIRNFPKSEDCLRSLHVAKLCGVTINDSDEQLVLTPPSTPNLEPDTIIDCGNSGTTARLLAGLLAGSQMNGIISGDESLSKRPMNRVVEPLQAMGAEIYATDGHLPMKISGKKLLPFEYRLSVPSAQVKSAILLAGLASSCSVTVREEILTRDHTELMISAIGQGITIRDIKMTFIPDPVDPRKKKAVMPENFKREISISGQAHINGGEIDIPGDLSTAAFFMAVAAITGKSVTINQVGLNPTRTGFIDHLRSIGCTVSITNRKTVSGEVRGDVTVTGGQLKARKIHGETIVELIDEIPIIAILAAQSDGTTIIRDAGELRVKESDRLAAMIENLQRMGVNCGLLEDGMAIEGRKELQGSDFLSYGDHRVAMACAIASLFASGPSTLDDESVVGISCPEFFDLLKVIAS